MSAAISIEPNDSPPDLESLRRRVAELVETRIMPLEADRANYDEHENIRLDVLEEVRGAVKQAGLWAPQMPRYRGGLGQTIAGMAGFFQGEGRPLFRPPGFYFAAPPDGDTAGAGKGAPPPQKSGRGPPPAG